MPVSHRVRAALRGGEPFLLLASAFLLTTVVARSFVIQSDEGYTVGAAWQLWSGMRMYDDFRVFVGPGSGYAVYGAWRLLGSPSFLAARVLSLALSFWSTVGFYLLLRRLRTCGLAQALAIIAWLVASSLYVLLNHNSFSAFAAIWFLLALVRVAQARAASAPEGDRPRDHLRLGALAGLVFLFLPMKASLLAASGAVFLFATRSPGRRLGPVLALALGFGAVIAPLFLRWSPAVLLRQWVIIPLTGNYLGHTQASGRFVVAAAVTVVIMGWAAWRLGDRALLALTLVQTALFLGMSHNMEASHFAVNAFPAIAFAAHVVGDRVACLRPAREISAGAIVTFFVGVVLVWIAVTPGGASYGADSVLEADLLGRRPPVIVKPKVRQAHAVYAGPFLPGLYYLLGKRNPFFVSETVVCDEDCQRRLVEQLERVKPELAFLDYAMIRLHYPETGPVDVYLRDHYTPCPTAAGIPVRAIDPAWCP